MQIIPWEGCCGLTMLFFFRGEVLPNLHEILTIYCNLFPVVACSQPCSSASSKEAHCGVPSARWLPWWWLLRIAGGIGTESRSTHGFAGPGLWMMFNPICRGVEKQILLNEGKEIGTGKERIEEWRTLTDETATLCATAVTILISSPGRVTGAPGPHLEW